MSKKKILLITISAIAAVVILFTAVIHPMISENVHKQLSEEHPPAEVVDFEEQKADTVRVMSFNVRCTNLGIIKRSTRNDEVIETIKKGMPDRCAGSNSHMDEIPQKRAGQPL